MWFCLFSYIHTHLLNFISYAFWLWPIGFKREFQIRNDTGVFKVCHVFWKSIEVRNVKRVSIRIPILLFITSFTFTHFLTCSSLHFTFFCASFPFPCECVCVWVSVSVRVCVCFSRNYLSSLSLVVSCFPFPFQWIVTQPISATEERVLTLIIAVKMNMYISACCEGTKWDEHSCFSVGLWQPNHVCLNSKSA